MEYNSQKDLLIIPEYGRNMQGIIRHAFTIKDKEERQAFIEKIVDLMQQMYPQGRNVKDSKLKLWQHIIRIAEKDLEINYPEGLSPEDQAVKPDMIKYPEEVKRFRHYGKGVKVLIAKAMSLDEGKRIGFAKTIASYMKMAYVNWHKELNVSDDIIKADLLTMSNGKLKLDDNYQINIIHSNRRNSNASRTNINIVGSNNKKNKRKKKKR